MRADGIRFMSRSTILLIAALGIVAVLARAWLLNPPTAPVQVPAPDEQAPAEVAQAAPSGVATPTPLPAPERAPGETLAAIERSKTALDAATELRHKARFPPTSGRIEDSVDPIAESRAVKERLSPPGQGRKPTLVVFASSLSYEAPNPIIIFAKFIREYPGNWAPRTDAEIAGELWNSADTVVAQVDLRDDGQGRDVEAGDGVFTVQLEPPTEDLQRWNGLIRVQIYGETADGDRRKARTRFYYGVPSAKLTGYYRDDLVNGHLQIQAEVEVKEIGEYRLEGTLASSKGLLAWAVSTVPLEPGISMIPLTFWGLALREANEPGPYTLASIALANVTYQPPQLNDAIGTTYQTAPYQPQNFSAESYNDPNLIDRAEGRKGKARGKTAR